MVPERTACRSDPWVRQLCQMHSTRSLNQLISFAGKNQAQFNNVTKIHFEDITMIDALYGAR